KVVPTCRASEPERTVVPVEGFCQRIGKSSSTNQRLFVCSPTGKLRAGFHVESGAVPGADHFIAFDLAFRQRSAAMRTGILNRVVSATHIENGDLCPSTSTRFRPSILMV